VQVLPATGPAIAWLDGHRPDAVIAGAGVLLRDGEGLLQAMARHDDPPALLSTPEQSEDSTLSEVVAHIEQAEGLRRQVLDVVRTTPARLCIGELVVDQAKRRAVFQGQLIPLTPTQYRLLHCLATHAGQVVGYRELLWQVWGFDAEESEARDLLKAHVRQIRRKMGLNAQRAEYLQSVRGFGYMLVDPYEDQVPPRSPTS
jgi:two-component system KDP operon response regulator KdpE